MNKIILFLVSAVIGFSLTKYLSGATEGAQGIAKSLIFYLGNIQIHLHHWIIFTVMLLVVFIFRKKIESMLILIIAGLLLGGIIQGFTYSDWWKIIN